MRIRSCRTDPGSSEKARRRARGSTRAEPERSKVSGTRRKATDGKPSTAESLPLEIEAPAGRKHCSTQAVAKPCGEIARKTSLRSLRRFAPAPCARLRGRGRSVRCEPPGLVSSRPAFNRLRPFLDGTCSRHLRVVPRVHSAFRVSSVPLPAAPCLEALPEGAARRARTVLAVHRANPSAEVRSLLGCLRAPSPACCVRHETVPDPLPARPTGSAADDARGVGWPSPAGWHP